MPYDQLSPWAWRTWTTANYLQEKIGEELNPRQCIERDGKVYVPEWMMIWQRIHKEMYNPVWENVDTWIIWEEPPQSHINP